MLQKKSKVEVETRVTVIDQSVPEKKIWVSPEIRNEFIPIGHPNRQGSSLKKIKAIVIHYTGNDSPGATDTANVKYMGRTFIFKDGKFFEGDGKTPFRFGSAHVFCDKDSITVGIPTTEVAWAVGDRPLPYSNGNKGQQSVATVCFDNQQNWESISVEICNNDDWNSSCLKAKAFVVDFILKNKINVDLVLSRSLWKQQSSPIPEGSVVILRHYDLTGKICPKPFVSDFSSWEEFVSSICKEVEEFR